MGGGPSKPNPIADEYILKQSEQQEQEAGVNHDVESSPTTTIQKSPELQLNKLGKLIYIYI